MNQEKQNAEIYRPMNEELSNNIDKQYQELAKVKAESEQIEEMAKIKCEHCASAFGACEQMPCKSVVEQAESLYNAGYRKQEWIGVEDRLPEDGQIVLTIDSQDEMEVCFYETACEGVFQQCGGLVKIFNITHWMPLPEAPKMRKEDDRE